MTKKKAPDELQYRPTREERFRSFTTVGTAPAHLPDLGPCEEWGGSITKRGYGRFGWADGDVRLAHRSAWELAHGYTKLAVLHACDNRRCVRISHLFLGTIDDNNKDMKAKGRSAIGERNGQSKLTEQQVREIRQRAARKEHQRDIAASFGLSQGTVSNIVTRKIWPTVL